MTGIQATPPDTPEHHIRMARIYLHEARKTIHRSWAFTLLKWAADRRTQAARLKQIGPAQKDLFA
jgi:hypothetical protein